MTFLPLLPRLAARLTALWCLPALAFAFTSGGPDTNPEAGTGYTAKQAVVARDYVAVTAHPAASQAAADMLARGGSAVDAAIAAQMVLTLTEPQSSGIGGGAFLLLYDATERHVRFIDGRETAPAASGPALFADGPTTLGFMQAVNSGRSVGVPGVLRALELAHRQSGKLPWKQLFGPAIDLADRGFVVSPRLASLVAGNAALREQAAARAYFFDGDGQPLRIGQTLRNPALAATLRRVADHGADAFYEGELAQAMVDAVAGHALPGSLSLQDLREYRAIERDPVCAPYRMFRVCGASPPSSGGIALLQMLGVASHTPLRTVSPDSVDAVHWFAEAGRLAYADRDRYVADPAFVHVPTEALIAPDYLARRAADLSPSRSMGKALPGEPEPALRASRGQDDTPELPSTTHLSIVDADGNAVSMTSTIEQAFGSKLMVGGFLLNNELTDFSLSPVDARGRPVANRVQAGKRPRSTMAPTIVLERQPGQAERLRLVIGAPGGSAIVNYVAKTVVANLDWGLDIQAAIDLPHRGSRNAATELERSSSLESLIPALRARGHHVTLHEFPSGLHGVEVLPDGRLRAGADPRREGTAVGQ